MIEAIPDINMNHSSEYEESRLKALHSYLLIDSEGRQEFNDLTELAATVCQTNHAYITLVDKKRLNFLTSYGNYFKELDRNLSFSEYTIRSESVFEITNVLEDNHFRHNPSVIGDPHIRYYCGAPLIDRNGFRLGALCVVDLVPRNLSETQKKSLMLLAKQVMNAFELHRREKNLEHERAELEEIVKQRTATLKDTNLWLSRIIDLVPHPIFLKDQHGKYLLANSAQGKLLGKKPEELLGKTDVDFVFNTDEYRVIKESDDAVVSSQKSCIIPEQIITFGETKYYLYTSKVPLISEVDGELRLLGVSIDLTEIRALQIEYNRSLEAYRKLVEISPDSIYIQSNDGRILFANPSGVKLLGAKHVNELIGTSVMSFIHPDSIQEVENRIGSADNHKNIISEQKAITLTGEVLDIEVVAVSFMFNGQPAEQVIVRDVTDKIKARDALFQSREEFRTLTENSTDIIARITTNHTFVYINKAITNSTGNPPEYYSNKTPEEAGFSLQLSRGIRFIIDKTIITRKTTSYYFENLQMEGAFRYAHVICVPEFDAEGEVVSVLNTVQDVTQLKQNELQLIQAGKDLDRFVYSASHELRAPLKSILGLTSIASYDILNNNYDELSEYISRIERSVMRLDETVKDVIEYSRNTRMEVVQEMVSFSEIIYHITDNLSSLSNFSRIQIQTEFNDETLFFSDRRRIQIVLNNIISNSIKYADVSKEQCYINIQVTTDRNECIIRISDNGIGIDTAYLQHIFDMFFRATSLNEGDGLGLYIVKETLNKLQGRIDVHSSLGTGTTFTIYIPNGKIL